MRLVKGLIAGALCAVTALSQTGCESNERVLTPEVSVENANPYLSNSVMLRHFRNNGEWDLHSADCSAIDANGDGYIDHEHYYLNIFAEHAYIYEAKPEREKLDRYPHRQHTYMSSVGHGFTIYRRELEEAKILYMGRKLGDSANALWSGTVHERACFSGAPTCARGKSHLVIEDRGDYRVVHVVESIRKCVDVKFDAYGNLAEGFEPLDDRFSTDRRLAKYKLRQWESTPADWWHMTDWTRIGDFIIRREAYAEKGSIRYDYKPLDTEHKCRFE